MVSIKFCARPPKNVHLRHFFIRLSVCHVFLIGCWHQTIWAGLFYGIGCWKHFLEYVSLLVFFTPSSTIIISSLYCTVLLQYCIHLYPLRGGFKFFVWNILFLTKNGGSIYKKWVVYIRCLYFLSLNFECLGVINMYFLDNFYCFWG